MKNKVIVSGCSYSAFIAGNAEIYPIILKRKYNYDVFNMAWSGQSNESIIKKIYDCIVNENVKDSLIICQLTWLHRMGWYHSIVNRWVDYQPKFIKTIPKYDTDTDLVSFKISMDETFMEGGEEGKPKDFNKEDYRTLTNMYKTWLEYVYDEDAMFDYLMYKIDLLKTFVESKGNKIKFIYWPDLTDNIKLQKLKNREFFNLENEYSMLRWSTKNNLVDETSHLSDKGHELFSGLINSNIENEFNYLKNINNSLI